MVRVGLAVLRLLVRTVKMINLVDYIISQEAARIMRYSIWQSPKILLASGGCIH